MENKKNNTKGYLTDKEYSYIYSRSTRICVDLVIVEAEQVLLLKREEEPHKGKWHLPGGRIRFGETINSAIKRIAKEEIGINVFVPKLIGWLEALREKQKGDNRHSVSLVFIMSINKLPKVGKFFSQPPNNIMPVHKTFLIENKYFK